MGISCSLLVIDLNKKAIKIYQYFPIIRSRSYVMTFVVEYWACLKSDIKMMSLFQIVLKFYDN